MKCLALTKCLVLTYDGIKAENKWIKGEVVGTRAGDANEDFDRIDVKVEGGIYEGCHPDCVKIIQ